MRRLILLLLRAALLLSMAAVVPPQMAEALLPAHDPARSILLSGFAVNKPEQLSDIDDIAQGLSHEIARRLRQSQQFEVRTMPDLLSFNWQLQAPPPRLLTQLGLDYGARYLITGEIRNAGIRNVPQLFGLWSKPSRSIEVEMYVYDAPAGNLLGRFEFSASADGDVHIGREHVFGGVGFRATRFGQAIESLVDEAAQTIASQLLMRP